MFSSTSIAILQHFVSIKKKRVQLVRTKSFRTILIIIAKIRRNFNVLMIEEENRSTSGYISVRMKVMASRKHLLNMKDNIILYVF